MRRTNCSTANRHPRGAADAEQQDEPFAEPDEDGFLRLLRHMDADGQDTAPAAQFEPLFGSRHFENLGDLPRRQDDEGTAVVAAADHGQPGSRPRG